MSKKNPHWGTTLDAFLAEDGIRSTQPIRGPRVEGTETFVRAHRRIHRFRRGGGTASTASLSPCRSPVHSCHHG